MTEEMEEKEEKKACIKSLFECDEYYMCFDKDGKKISLKTFSELVSDRYYRRVASDHVGFYHVSTIWLGINHSFSLEQNKPIIFETMIFGGKFEEEDSYMERYSTEFLALEGHKRAIEMLKLEYK